MPLPVLPVARLALRYGVPALVTWAATRATLRAIDAGRTDQAAEDALDAVPDGITAHRLRDAPQSNATLRLRRVLRWEGGGVEIDAAALGRLRVRRL